MAERKVGTVRRWTDRGFGFITPEGSEEEVFVHFSAITDGNALEEGAAVEYETVFDDRKGKERAEGVTGGFQQDDRPARSGGGDRGRGRSSGQSACYNCGQVGHLSRDCPEPRKDNSTTSRECYNCGLTGHLSRECPEPRKEGGGGGGRGGGGGGGGGRPRGPCFDFQKGICNRGAECRFSHEAEQQAAPGAW